MNSRLQKRFEFDSIDSFRSWIELAVMTNDNSRENKKNPFIRHRQFEHNNEEVLQRDSSFL